MDSSRKEDSAKFDWETSMKTAIQIGIPISEYEEMTPYELSLAVEAYMEMAEMETKERITLAWLGEYYHRQKYLPSLEKALRLTKPTQPKVMTDDEMLATAKRLNALFGGTFEKGEHHGIKREESTSDSL